MSPLVTIGLKCYNQASYIADALCGVLSQTYRPLEVVISDDGSTDESWSIIESIVEKYAPKDISIILNRNEKNLGNVGNWQRVCELSHGSILVKADGDDISLPERVECLVELFNEDGDLGIVYSSGLKIDEEGREIGTLDEDILSRHTPLGATMACVRECFSDFGMPDDLRAADDMIYHERARILGKEIVWSGHKLVKYRYGAGVSTTGRVKYCGVMQRMLKMTLDSLSCSVKDAEGRNAAVHADLVARKMRIANEYPLWVSDSFRVRLNAFRQAHSTFVFNKFVFVHVLLLLPFRLGHGILNMIFK